MAAKPPVSLPMVLLFRGRMQTSDQAWALRRRPIAPNTPKPANSMA
jgi:hypothetical protein